jgi:hypothetical protein
MMTLSVSDGNVYLLTHADDETLAQIKRVIESSPYRDLPLSRIRGTGQCFFVYERDGRILGYVVVAMVPYVDSLIVDRTLPASQRAIILGRLLRAVEKYVRSAVALLRRQAHLFGVPNGNETITMPSLVAHVWKGDREWFDRLMNREKLDGWIVYPDHVLVVKELEG